MEDTTSKSVVRTVQLPADEYTRRRVTVDFLYLDTESCERCIGTEDALETALDRLDPLLAPLDVGLTVRKIHVSDLAAAEATQLAVSPTIRIDGRDIQPDYIENTCESCGDLCDCEDAVDCRLWRYRGETQTTAPVEILIEALVAAVAPTHAVGAPDGDAAPQLSATVRGFFGDADADESTSARRSTAEATAESDCGCGCRVSDR